MKKKDLLIIIIIVFIVIGGFIFNYINFSDKGVLVQISINNDIYQTVSLKENKTIKLDCGNTITIKDNTVIMKDASCPDKLCVKQGKITKNGEQIICLPHKVVVAIIGK